MRSFRYPLIILLFITGLLYARNLGDEFRVNIFTQYNQSRPAAAMDTQGNFLIAWDSEKQDGDVTGIYARMYTNYGDPKGYEFQVNSITDHFQLMPSIAAAKNGTFIITWICYRLSQGGNIAARRFDSSGNPLGLEFAVNTFLDGYQGEPDVAADGQGNFIIVWQSWEQDGDGFGIFARKYSASGVPEGIEFQVNTTAVDDQVHPSAAMDDAGNCVFVWTSYSQDGALSGIYGQRMSSSGIFLGPEFRIDQAAVGYRDFPDLIMDQWGNFVVCWQDIRFTPEGYDIYLRIFDRNGIVISPETLVNTTTEDSQIFPAAAADAQGNFIIVWQSMNQDGDSFGIYAQRFDLNGSLYGLEQKINQTVTGSQEMPAAAVFSMENFVVVWESTDAAHINADIFARWNGTTTFTRKTSKEPTWPRKHSLIK